MQKVQPYTGNEPYIFFSYAHRNNDAALQIIGRLMDAGYRVWYDEGIDPGTEFAEIIAAHVKGCSYFMALMSPAYLDSEYCKDELDYARNLNKPRVLVYLQDVTLPDWMQMRLSRIQAIHKYTYQDENAFYTKLFQAQGIRTCLKEGYAGDGTVPAVKKKPVARVPERMEMVQPKAVSPAKRIEGLFPVALLKEPVPVTALDESYENEQAEKLKKLLSYFKIPSQLQGVVHGASVTQYVLSFGPEVKVSELKAIEDNIARALDVFAVRMEIPIPGTKYIGIEAPRETLRTVMLREVLQSEEMQYAKGALPVALGVYISGRPIICDLARMPHLMMGGVAGAGKSLCIHSIILSLLYCRTPQEVQLMLADPTGVELQMYKALPHLRCGIVSEPAEICARLSELVSEMMERYTRFQEKGVRNIDGYNAACGDTEEKMPRIVFIIDELSELMRTCKNEAEEAICRLAQLSRAAGIHLVIATNWLTAGVVSGMLRANIPSRIAFRCPTVQESRILLDKSGAEKLMGYGDMLYAPSAAPSPLRAQGCFVPEEDCQRVAAYFSADADGGVQFSDDQKTNPAEMSDELREWILSIAEVAAANGGALSTSLLQRKLAFGYGKAARLMEEMERLDMVSPADGPKPRKCFLTPAQAKILLAEGKEP